MANVSSASAVRQATEPARGPLSYRPMHRPPGNERWLPSFRRCFTFLRPHARTLVIGLVAAIGVSVCYTFSMSSIIPLLKVFFADHETLADWAS